MSKPILRDPSEDLRWRTSAFVGLRLKSDIARGLKGAIRCLSPMNHRNLSLGGSALEEYIIVRVRNDHHTRLRKLC